MVKYNNLTIYLQWESLLTVCIPDLVYHQLDQQVDQFHPFKVPHRVLDGEFANVLRTSKRTPLHGDYADTQFKESFTSDQDVLYGGGT